MKEWKSRRLSVKFLTEGESLCPGESDTLQFGEFLRANCEPPPTCCEDATVNDTQCDPVTTEFFESAASLESVRAFQARLGRWQAALADLEERVQLRETGRLLTREEAEEIIAAIREEVEEPGDPGGGD